jgi:hypothetical protein
MATRQTWRTGKFAISPPPGHKLVRAWNGMRVRLVRPLSNGWGELAAGTIATVEGAGNGMGLQIRTDPCPHCGVKLFMSRVLPSDLEILENL